MSVDGRLLLVGIAVLGLAASIAAAVGGLPFGGVIVAVFLAVGPGLAVMALAGVTDRVALLALVVPVSVSIDALIASAVLYLGIWSPQLVVALIVLVTVGMVVVAQFDRPARAALIPVGLLPGIVILAGVLAAEALI
jgi:hypothetical protein